MEVTYRGTVYPSHCDHMGHMNVMWYVGKFDEATWQLFSGIGITPDYLRTSGRGMVAVDQRISYRREVRAGDVVLVRSTILEARSKVIRFCHQMENAATGETAAITVLTGSISTPRCDAPASYPRSNWPGRKHGDRLRSRNLILIIPGRPEDLRKTSEKACAQFLRPLGRQSGQQPPEVAGTACRESGLARSVAYPAPRGPPRAPVRHATGDPGHRTRHWWIGAKRH
jgi:acyl-CoA thioester hydrolase